MGIRVRRPYAGKVMNRLARFPEVKYLYYTCGRYDILGSVICASEDKIYEVVEEKIARLEGVESADVLLPLRTVHTNRWLEALA
jgi:DNA-binding Lrp family transcriptional regulator